MRKVLIAHGSEELSHTLALMLGGKFDVFSCNDGNTALECLNNFQPEILILDFMLPYKDGLTVLELASPFRPPIILGTVRYRSHYILRSAEAHGVGYIMLEPCEARNIVVRLMDMIVCSALPPQNYEEPQSEVTRQLLRLGLRSGLDGFTQLRVGIPLFAQDSAQRLSKELYPAIARLCGYDNPLQVEHSIRSAIQIAWSERDPEIWNEFFPNHVKPPSNKLFISRLATAMLEKLNQII